VIYDTVRELAAHGINRLYVDTFNNGKVYFNSSAMAAFAGPGALGPDRLGMYMDAAKDFGMEVYGWFEYGLMANYGSTSQGNAFAEAAESAGWIIGGWRGWQWMHPTKATPFLKEMILEASTGVYAGVKPQLDDHFACPSALSVCSAELLTEAARVVGPVTYSLSPSPLAFAQSSLNVYWDTWAQEGIFQEFVPQLYTASFSSFDYALGLVAGQVPPSVYREGLLVGIRLDGTGAPTSWPNVEKMIDATEAAGLGAVIWYSRGILELYSSQFQQKWGGALPAPPAPPPPASNACTTCLEFGGGVGCLERCSSQGSDCAACVQYGGGAGCIPRCG